MFFQNIFFTNWISARGMLYMSTIWIVRDVVFSFLRFAVLRMINKTVILSCTLISPHLFVVKSGFLPVSLTEGLYDRDIQFRFSFQNPRTQMIMEEVFMFAQHSNNSCSPWSCSQVTWINFKFSPFHKSKWSAVSFVLGLITTGRRTDLHVMIMPIRKKNNFFNVEKLSLFVLCLAEIENREFSHIKIF